MASRPRLTVARRLLDWFARGHRDLPWRSTSDPYRIWISEIMLQQTRAGAVIPYYHRFLERFPDLDSLARSREQDVLALWSGLGYYSRARNLRRAASLVSASGFPRDYDSIRALPGIGDYTAAAIASISFQLPYAVADGNVFRVVARVENDSSDIASARTRERFRSIAQEWLDPRRPGAFNQALMELGATVCVPRNPLCVRCPLAPVCRSRAAGTSAQLPVKLRRTEPVHIQGSLLIVERRGRILLRRRGASLRRMAGFWDLPAPEDLPGAIALPPLGTIRHTITRYRYSLAVTRAKLPAAALPADFEWFLPSALAAVPLSTTARKALKMAGILPVSSG